MNNPMNKSMNNLMNKSMNNPMNKTMNKPMNKIQEQKKRTDSLRREISPYNLNANDK